MSLFRGSRTERVFRFLAAGSSIMDELLIIASLPWAPFLRALGGVLRRQPTGGKGALQGEFQGGFREAKEKAYELS